VVVTFALITVGPDLVGHRVGLADTWEPRIVRPLYRRRDGHGSNYARG
jgi:hypothetical protein